MPANPGPNPGKIPNAFPLALKGSGAHLVRVCGSVALTSAFPSGFRARVGTERHRDALWLTMQSLACSSRSFNCVLSNDFMYCSVRMLERTATFHRPDCPVSSVDCVDKYFYSYIITLIIRESGAISLSRSRFLSRIQNTLRSRLRLCQLESFFFKVIRPHTSLSQGHLK